MAAAERTLPFAHRSCVRAFRRRRKPIFVFLCSLPACLPFHIASCTPFAHFAMCFEICPHLLQENCKKFEDEVSAQCDQLINAIVDRRAALFTFIAQEKEAKLKTIKEQVSAYTCKLQKTTALLQFCVEALKEKDASSFLQVRTHSSVSTREWPLLTAWSHPNVRARVNRYDSYLTLTASLFV